MNLDCPSRAVGNLGLFGCPCVLGVSGRDVQDDRNMCKVFQICFVVQIQSSTIHDPGTPLNCDMSPKKSILKRSLVQYLSTSFAVDSPSRVLIYL